MSYRTLIDCDSLARELGNSSWRVFDCRFSLKDTDAGRRAYAESHIPGARYVHLDEDLSGALTPTSGRHPLPSPDAFAARLGRWGVANSTQVVCYDGRSDGPAARMWWMLRWLGHEAVAVLDGGFEAWRAAGLPLSHEVPDFDPVQFVAHVNDGVWVDTPAIEANLASGECAVVDARAHERFRGEREPLDAVAGHIPGAICLPHADNVDTDGFFLSPERLRRRFEDALGPARSAAQVVHSCGSGVSACHNLLAMEIAGLGGSRLYPGSWSAWISDSQRPVATGA